MATDRAFGPGPFDSAAEREAHPRIHELDRPVVASLDGGNGGVTVEAHLQVRQQDAARAGPRGEVAHDRPVEVLGIDRYRTGPEAHLAQQGVARADERLEVGRTPQSPE